MKTFIQISNFLLNFAVYLLLPYLFLGIFSILIGISYHKIATSTVSNVIMYVYAFFLTVVLGEGSEATKPYLFRIPYNPKQEKK